MRARALVTAWVVAAIMVPYSYALAAIIFHGPLAAFAVRGGSLMLAGTAVLTLIVALTSGYRGALPSPSGIPGAVLATMSTAVAASMAHAAPKTAFMTVAALVVVSSVVSGALVLAIGWFRLSNYFRFIPYPVTAGFFAGAGWVLSVATIGTMSATPIAWDTLALLTEPAVLWRWVPGAVFATALLVAMRRAPGTFTLITVLCAGTALFHGALAVLGMPVDEARTAGLLLSGIPDDALWEPFTTEEIADVDWSVLGAQLPGVLVVAAISLICVLIHIAGLEASTGTQLELDREMRSMGMGTIGGGASLAAPGIHALSLCLAARAMRAETPWTGVFAALWMVATLLFGSAALGLIPTAIAGGMLLFIGIDLVSTWLVEVRRKLPWTDYAVVCLIALTIVFFGFVEGVAVGMLATLVLFAARLARTNVIAAHFTGREVRSTKLRSIPERALLLEHGDSIHVFKLRGYVFFGSVYPMVDRLKEYLDDSTGRASFIVLDCTGVLGFDVSAVNVISAYVRAAHASARTVVVCNAPTRLESNMTSELPPIERCAVRFEAGLDAALEHCEDAVIATALEGTRDERDQLFERSAVALMWDLERLERFEALARDLEGWTERRSYAPGQALDAGAGTQEDLHLVLDGRISSYDAHGVRVGQYGPGTVFGGHLEHQGAASALADEQCATRCLTGAAKRVLEATEPQLAIRLYRAAMERT